MPTRNVVLTEHQQAFIGELVRSGRYSNASEVLRESLRLMERRESLEAAKLDYLRGRLEEVERDAAAGRLVTYSPGLLDSIGEEIEGESAGTGSSLRLCAFPPAQSRISVAWCTNTKCWNGI